MIRGRFLRTGDDIAPILALREQVFVQEMGQPPSVVRDEMDDMAIYALVFDEGNVPSGAGRLALDDDKFLLGRICVRSGARGQGLGDLIMRMLLLRATEMNAPGVYVKALLPVVRFYQRYGLRTIGDVFEEEGAAHQLMHATSDEIDIEGTCQKRSAGCAGCKKPCAEQ